MYVPVNALVYTAAYCGALGGATGTAEPAVNVTIDNYEVVGIVAGKFAKAFDILWGVRATTDLDIRIIEEVCSTSWEKRRGQISGSEQSYTIYSTLCATLIKIAEAAKAYYVTQGITPPGVPANSAAITTAVNAALVIAADDATAKAGAALTAANANAATLANDAQTAAAADATTKANGAVTTAAADATTKANNALTAAQNYTNARSGWVTALDLDYTVQPTQVLAANGNYDIGGVVHTKINSVNDSVAMQVTNGIGLVQKPGVTSGYSGSARTCPAVTVDLASLIPGYYPEMRVRVWARVSYINQGASAQDMPYLVVEPGNNQLGYTTLNYSDGNKKQQSFVAFGGFNPATADTTNPGDDVLIIEASLGDVWMFGRSGVWAGGWPTDSAVHHRARANAPVVNAYDLSFLGAAVWDVLLGAGRNGSGNALEVTWKNLRIDYKP